MNQHCPSCAEKICPPSGSKDSPILIIGEHPGKAEMEIGRPFATHHMYVTAGAVFRKELARVGLDLVRFRVTNLLLHEPNDNENCVQAGYELALEEAKGKSAILLVGSDVVEKFTNYKVSDVSGLQVDSAILSAPVIYAMVNPALALQPGRGIGEVRHAIQKFAARLEKEQLL